MLAAARYSSVLSNPLSVSVVLSRLYSSVQLYVPSVSVVLSVYVVVRLGGEVRLCFGPSL